MPEHECPATAEETEKVAGVAHGPFLVEEPRSAVEAEPGHECGRSVSRHSSEPTLEAEDAAPDLEQMATASTGPVYSAFGKRKKIYIVTMVTWAAFISPTSANIYFPALNPLQEELRVTPTLINLTLTSYMIFQGLAPTIFGDLADMAGRRPAYIVAFAIYLGANIGLALQDSYAALFILRCMQAFGSSSAIALGYAVVADVSTSAER